MNKNGHRRVALVLGALLCALAPAGAASASEYHSTAYDIRTSQGRTCGHGTNGWPGQVVLGVFRDVESETSVICDYGASGQPAEMYANLYLEYSYGRTVAGLGVGGVHYNGTCHVVGQYCNVHVFNRDYNVPTEYELQPWTTYLLPTSGTEQFTAYPGAPSYDCRAYYRAHATGNYPSGLTCFGEGTFTTP